MKMHFLLFIPVLAVATTASAQNKNDKPFTDTFMQDSCTFETTGRNAYFILEPGYQLTLEGTEGKNNTRLIITVLNDLKQIRGIETRVVEEKESLNGKLIEISRNFFAFCKQTGTVFYFGEEVDIYKDSKIINHEGAWIAEGKNKSGVMMPGLILTGSRFYNEIAPGIAMDRAEIISTGETIKIAAGNFADCIKVEETTPLEPKAKDYKVYAPGIGLVKDGELLLVKYGYIK